ncbi:DNA glycosylase AlkZ-like family protein [Microbacterium radiodurans]|uniref:Winged helix-turn-helix domain-containing protein n=1 Tax=Microbacterium radiodurans TaxID=661398 RepID=A0A5J5IPS9_9MICO|nr:crosslink repair DNA glycosylase YcaQ family protein [Microbacterium radiodurans]KAA9085208.1 winged helix-turn-helix domain-containing protein [Microbacterium radiodurans]
MHAHELTREQARRIIVRAQLLEADRPGDVVEVAEQLGAIKIDPTAVIAPSEQAILWSRIGWGYEPGQLPKAVEDDRQLFEYAGSFHPMSMLPAMRARMRERTLRESTAAWLEANAAFRADLLSRLRDDGPLLAADIPDTAAVPAGNDSGWYSDNQVPRMLDLLERLGEVAVVGRVGRLRRWDVADRARGPEPDLDADEAAAILDDRRLQAAGLARQKSSWSAVGMAGEPAAVEGSMWKWRVDPRALDGVDDDRGGRVALLNPYDGMLFDRPRLVEAFDFTYKLEQFVPKAQRVYGYFAHPILCGDRFIGLLDAALDKPKENLVVAAIHELVPWESEEREAVEAEIRDLADWLGAGLRGLD